MYNIHLNLILRTINKLEKIYGKSCFLYIKIVLKIFKYKKFLKMYVNKRMYKMIFLTLC